MKYNPKSTAIPEIIPAVLICTAGIISASRMHLYLALLLHRDYFRRSDSSLSCSFVPQGLFLPAGCISIFLFCPTGIISTSRMHLYLALFFHRDYFAPVGCISIFLFCFTGIISAGRIHLYLPLLSHRDYFRRPDSSLSCSFAPQGLFPPAECISILLFCYTGIISAGRIHLYLPLLLHRDYFRRSDASLSSSFAPQGLFPPAECISIFLFSSTGIISAARIHLYPALFHHRDYFCRPDSSLSSSFAPQGLFPPVGFISILLFCSTEIISTVRMHLYLPLLSHRDYFRRPDSSLSSSFAPQGLFPPVGFISILLFCSTEIISTVRMHLYLPLLSHRDYFRRPDSSLSSSFAPQGLFPPPEFISILLFCFTGIISAGRMHLYLALLLHRDYFQRPDASPACSFVTQGLFRPAECISNPGSCKVSATKLLLHRKHSYGFC